MSFRSSSPGSLATRTLVPRPECPPHEDVVRAITTAYWDPAEGRITSALFRGRNLSVSRLAILRLDELFRVFERDLSRPTVSVLAAGEINVGRLQEIGRTHSTPIELTVEIAPLEANPAHAEIPQSISRGLSHRIIAALRIHHPEQLQP